MRVFALIWLFLIILQQSSNAQAMSPDTHVGDFIFAKPTNWKQLDKEGVTAFYPATVTSDKMTMMLFITRPLKSELRSTFQSEVALFEHDYTVKQSSEIAGLHTVSGLDMITSNAVLVDRKGITWAAQFFAGENGKHLEGIVFLTNYFGGDAVHEDAEALKTVLSSLKFTGMDATRTDKQHPSAAHQPINTGSRTTAKVYRSEIEDTNILTSSTHLLAYRYVTFFPDHVFYEGKPDHGLDGYEREAEKSHDHEVGWGTWSGTRAKGTITFPPNEYLHMKDRLVWDYSSLPNGVIVNKVRYRLMDPCDNLKLNGTYHPIYDPSRAGITFTSDGRFVDQGAFKSAGVSYRTSRSPIEDDDGIPGSGTYWIGNYTLLLKYSDGRVKQTFFFKDNGSAKPNWIMLNTYEFSAGR